MTEKTKIDSDSFQDRGPLIQVTFERINESDEDRCQFIDCTKVMSVFLSDALVTSVQMVSGLVYRLEDPFNELVDRINDARRSHQ